MSSPKSLPVVGDVEEETSEGPKEAAEEQFNFKNWLQESLREREEMPEYDGQEKYSETLDTEDGNTEDGFLKTLSSVVEEYGKKRLFVCCDGTWLNASGTVAPLSNVAKLARSVHRVGSDSPSLETIDGVPQLVYYSSGVGTQSTLQMDSNVAAVTGKGISGAIRDAYCFLSNNYNGVSNRDEIILVGFSRGAFTVRCLAEFISRVGLLRRNALPFLPVFFEDWVTGNDKLLEKRLEDMETLFYKKPKIKILAEWDPVDTLGVPHIYDSGLERRMEAQIVPKQVEHAFLALSLGEKRLSYWPTVWKKSTATTIEVNQCAFLGDHGDVGGGHPDPGLSTISLLWMVSKIRSACDANFQTWALLQFNTPLWRTDSHFGLGRFRKRHIGVRNLANTKGIVHQPSLWWFLPNYLTLGSLFSGKRGSIIRELAANQAVMDEPAKDDAAAEIAAGLNEPNEVSETFVRTLEVHRTVRLLKETRRVSPSPLYEVVELPDHRYKWTMEGSSELPIYEQQLGYWEKKLLRSWKMEAQIWQEGSSFGLHDDIDETEHNLPRNWEGLTNKEVWGFERGRFDESLIKLVCDQLD